MTPAMRPHVPAVRPHTPSRRSRPSMRLVSTRAIPLAKMRSPRSDEEEKEGSENALCGVAPGQSSSDGADEDDEIDDDPNEVDEEEEGPDESIGSSES